MTHRRLVKELICAVSLATGSLSNLHAADPQACAAKLEACTDSCKQRDSEAAIADCVTACGADAKRCESSEVEAPAAPAASSEPAVASPAATEPSKSADTPVPAEPPATQSSTPSEVVAPPEPATELPSRTEQPTPATPAVLAPALDTKAKPAESKTNVSLTASAMKVELKKNSQMLIAIRAADFGDIRRLIETKGLNPTYVYSYQPIPQSNLYEAKPARLRLSDIFNDTNTFRRESEGLDRVLALFIEMGMDVKATLASETGQGAQKMRTAWGPDFQFMEAAKDRESRLKALDLALKSGLTPNEEFGAQLFEELPQICGRDRSAFAVQVFEVLIANFGPAMKDYVRRPRDGGTETIADVIDRSYSQRQPKNAYEKEQFARQDAIWENCSSLSRRINRFLKQGS